MRTIVSPVFTSGKLKLMVPHVDKCGDNMEELLRTASMTGEVLEAKEMYGKFTLDSIATSGFGIESNSYKDPDNIFRINARKLVRWGLVIIDDGINFKNTFSSPRDPKYASSSDILKFLVIMVTPKLAKLLGIYMFDKSLCYFFINIVRKTMENRR